jgi:hypothetical protein
MTLHSRLWASTRVPARPPAALLTASGNRATLLLVVAERPQAPVIPPADIVA